MNRFRIFQENSDCCWAIGTGRFSGHCAITVATERINATSVETGDQQEMR